MRTACDIKVSPIVNEEWWNETAVYSKFRRQGIDLTCCSFVQKIYKPKANIVFTTGLTESFIKYSETIQFLYERGFNVFSYDHQSQGLSGRWLPETQSLWVNTFEDYVDDFIYFVTSISKEYTHLQVFVLTCSMGGLINAIAMSRLPSLVSRAVLCAPMFRNKCGIKYFNYQQHLPQPIVYWVSYLACWAGLGRMHALGFFKEVKTIAKSHATVTMRRYDFPY
jgi:alpha-beta hydrolase superfamily lysophospholipase